MTQYQTFPDAAGHSLTLDKLKAIRLPDLAGKTFLDVGCNEGFFCGFARFRGAARSVGIDHSAQFIARARERFPDCEFLHQGWDTLPAGPFDVILLASALHYAEDQPKLIRELVSRLSPGGTLVLELGVVSSRKAEWRRVERGIDERMFPSMPMLREVLGEYAWKWMGPSIVQQGDPVQRHVVHVSRRRPVAYLLMEPPGYGKSSIASGLFPRAGVQIVSGDERIGLVARGQADAAPALRAAIVEDYSPFRIDQIIQRLFDLELGGELVGLWLDAAGDGDVAVDAYVPERHQAAVERMLDARGYLSVRLRWERPGMVSLPQEAMAEQAEAFYMSLVENDGDSASRETRQSRWEPIGFVDELSVEAGTLVIRGWAIDAAGELPQDIRVKLGRRRQPARWLDRQLRPDVQQHLGLTHALVGYRVCIDAPAVRSASDLGRGFEVSAAGGKAFRLAGKIGEIFHYGRGEGNRE